MAFVPQPVDIVGVDWSKRALRSLQSAQLTRWVNCSLSSRCRVSEEVQRMSRDGEEQVEEVEAQVCGL